MDKQKEREDRIYSQLNLNTLPFKLNKFNFFLSSKKNIALSILIIVIISSRLSLKKILLLLIIIFFFGKLIIA